MLIEPPCVQLQIKLIKYYNIFDIIAYLTYHCERIFTKKIFSIPEKIKSNIFILVGNDKNSSELKQIKLIFFSEITNT